MTLSVEAFYIDDDVQHIDIELPSDSSCNHLAGIESSRRTFYGSELAISLGLSLLPQLAESSMLEVTGETVEVLEAEVRLLLANLDGFNDDGYWLFRLNNILAMIELAKPFGDKGVVSIG
jgi:hypothetical protein